MVEQEEIICARGQLGEESREDKDYYINKTTLVSLKKAGLIKP